MLTDCFKNYVYRCKNKRKTNSFFEYNLQFSFSIFYHLVNILVLQRSFLRRKACIGRRIQTNSGCGLRRKKNAFLIECIDEVLNNTSTNYPKINICA